jgi:hypothetical protein
MKHRLLVVARGNGSPTLEQEETAAVEDETADVTAVEDETADVMAVEEETADVP